MCESCVLNKLIVLNGLLLACLNKGIMGVRSSFSLIRRGCSNLPENI